MKKRSTLLLVISILLLIFGVFGLISNIISLSNRDSIDALMVSAGLQGMSTFAYVFAIILSVIQLLAGLSGVIYKSKSFVLISGGLYGLGALVNIIYSIMTTGFTPFLVLGLLFPILYLWGWYQSN